MKIKYNFLIVGLITASTFQANSQNWLLGGNGPLGINATNNVLGTNNNLPVRVETSNTERMRINENTLINAGYLGNPGLFAFSAANYPLLMPMNANGYVGIRTGSPRAMLHIRGPEGIFGSGTGWRPWMKTGVYINEQSNNMYVGMYHVDSTGTKRPDAVVNWGDDNINASTPTRMRFIFTPSIGVIGTGVVAAQNRDMEMMSVWPDRNVGIGDFINFTSGPQSHLHVHNAFGDNDFIQISNNVTGTTTTDGLRIGVTGPTNEVHIRQQENSNIRILTNAAGAANERIRITQIGAPGLNNPAGLPANVTRVSISHNPSNPVTQPLSLLHLGYNTTGTISPLNGWRPWMDVGTFISQGTDNMYFGLKREPSNNPINQGDRYDAVINWGDNMQNPLLQEGPDNLRFLFTSGINDPFGTTQSRSTNGVEVMRLTPNNLVNNPQVINKPSVGIGDFTGIPIDANNYVGATLDIDGDARIRSVQQNESLNQVLVRDPNDYGRLYWRDANNLSGAAINANNGCSTDPLNANTVQFGQNINAAGNPAQLLNYREIPMNNQNVYFLGQNATTQGVNAIGIGYPNSISNLPAKLSVWEDPGQPVAYNTVGVLGRNSSASPALNGPFYYIGVAGASDGVDLTDNKNIHIGGYFSSDGGVVNYGVMGLANTGNGINDNFNYGGFLRRKQM
ncbi:MAG: hypothetical protein N2167_00325 [Flavobacteriales bacterium]|nr:hypothetical protein [Flavobacteriales bacterium]